jgi:hypothetical protein
MTGSTVDSSGNAVGKIFAITLPVKNGGLQDAQSKQIIFVIDNNC